jgi:hypothetical protein
VSATPGPQRPAALVCGAPGKNGPCQAYRATGTDTCRRHGPQAAEVTAELHAAAKVRAEEAAKVRLDTPEAIAQLIEETASTLRAGLIAAGAAMAMDRLCRTALASLEAQQLEAATRELAERRAQEPVAARRRK